MVEVPTAEARSGGRLRAHAIDLGLIVARRAGWEAIGTFGRTVGSAATLADEIKRAQAAGDPDTGETYYRHWLNALERMVAAKGLADAQVLARYRDAWDRAAERTPHGTPIVLKPEDFAD